MRKSLLSHKSIICFAVLIMVISSGCSAIFAASTPQKLQLVNGELDACLLVTSTELETVMGFKTITDSHPINPAGTSCLYSNNGGNSVLRIFVTTDESLKRIDFLGTTKDLYNLSKSEERKEPELYYQVEDIDGLGSQAYFSVKQNWELNIHVLNNGIFYEFAGYSTVGANREKLIQISKIALQRAP